LEKRPRKGSFLLEDLAGAVDLPSGDALLVIPTSVEEADLYVSSPDRRRRNLLLRSATGAKDLPSLGVVPTVLTARDLHPAPTDTGIPSAYFDDTHWYILPGSHGGTK
jgi:hypothetical protein